MQRIPDEIARAYRDLLRRLQRDVLVLLLVVSAPLSVLFALDLGQNTLAGRAVPSGVFTLHLLRIAIIYTACPLLIVRGHMRAAWWALLGASLPLLVVQMGLLGEPGLLVFALFSLAGPALVMPLALTLALAGGLLAASGGLVYQGTLPFAGWTASATLFGSLMLGLCAVGVVLRRFLRGYAAEIVASRVALEREARLAQRAEDLRSQVARLTSLNHDIRQPLRAVQGYVTLMAAHGHAPAAHTAPALAAAERAERLVSNLLDEARAATRPLVASIRPIALTAWAATLQRLGDGLSHYYTYPPAPVEVRVSGETLHGDAALLERAILNLLDNALAQTPPDGRVRLTLTADETSWCISVRDDGPGIPPKIAAALGAPASAIDGPPLGLGLRQVRAAVAAHHGSICVEGGAVVMRRMTADGRQPVSSLCVLSGLCGTSGVVCRAFVGALAPHPRWGPVPAPRPPRKGCAGHSQPPDDPQASDGRCASRGGQHRCGAYLRRLLTTDR